MKLINIYTTAGQLEGEMIKAFLKSQGIQAEINQESVAKTIGLSAGRLGEVHVLVPENQVSEAVACLRAMEAGEYEDLVDYDSPDFQETDYPDP